MTLAILSLLLVLLMSGMPIFAALALTSLGVLALFEGSVDGMADAVFSSLNSPVLATIPMFAFMAHVMIKAKVVDDLYEMSNTLVGHVKGGLSFATILSCTIFSTISGSSVATALTIGSISIPQMKRFGYPQRDTYGLIAAGGTLGILIPPSGPMILYAVVTDASIGALFLAGILPGLMMAAIFAGFGWLRARRLDSIRSQPWQGLGRVAASLRKSVWAVLMPPLILGGIYLGVFTASEAAAVGAV